MGTLIVFKRIEVPITDMITVCDKPLSLLRHDSLSKTLSRVDDQVRAGSVPLHFITHCVNLQEYLAYFKPHPMKEKAAGRPVIILPLVLFSDDTSGNRSKKWHKFDSWSVTLAGLSRHENSKISNLHLCCCSDVVSAMEMSEAIANDLKHLENEGAEAYDVHLQQMVIIVSPLMCLVADNPRASEVLSHLGGAARKYCRMCTVSI